MKGKKTYLAAAAALLGAVAGVLSGTVSVPDAAQIAVNAVLAATLRHAVSN